MSIVYYLQCWLIAFSELSLVLLDLYCIF